MIAPQPNPVPQWELADFLESVDPVIYGVISRNAVRGVETEDIAQDSRLALCATWYRYRNGKDIQDPESLAAKVTQCICIKHIHRAQKDRLIRHIDPHTIRAVQDSISLCDVDTHDMDVRECLREALLNLSITDLEILVRRYVYDHTYNQIAGELEVHTSTVCRRVRRIISYLRKRIG